MMNHRHNHMEEVAIAATAPSATGVVPKALRNSLKPRNLKEGVSSNS
jgi:hypothetical protein